jgi:hypothetical protein
MTQEGDENEVQKETSRNWSNTVNWK